MRKKNITKKNGWEERELLRERQKHRYESGWEEKDKCLEKRKNAES